MHRPQDLDMPYITTQWHQQDTNRTENNDMFRLQSWYLEESALFKKFDQEEFYRCMLPQEPISFRTDPKKSVSGQKLDQLLNNFVTSLLTQGKSAKYQDDFIIIKDRDFNYKTHAGLIVVKFSKYPFIAKIFIENPKSFTQPFTKGFEPSCLFFLGGGINRYLTGFTRIKNLQIIQQRIQHDPYWRSKIDVPRKWYWQPMNNKWFRLSGYHIGNKTEQTILLPSVYALVSDYIESRNPYKLRSRHDRNHAMRYSRFLGDRIDAHIYNFMEEDGPEKEESTQPAVIVVDTEHFPSMIGLREPLVFDSYASWYTQLMQKACKDILFRTKKEHRLIQKGIIPPIMNV